MFTFTVNEQVVGIFYAFPAVVTVHCVVAAHDTRDCSGALFAVILDFLKESCTAFGVSVTTVHEGVDEHLVQTISLCCVAKSVEMT